MKKRLLSTLLALCVVLALVPAAGAAGVEDYKYFKFTNDPVGCYQVTISGQVLPAVWVFPDGTKLTITIPDGGSVSYFQKEYVEVDDLGLITVDGFGPISYIDWDPEEPYSVYDGVTIWSVYATEDPGLWKTVEDENGNKVSQMSQVEGSLEQIYVCTQSTFDAWVAAGVATVTEPGTQPAEPAEPEQPSEPTTPTTPPAGKVMLSPQKLAVNGETVECEKYNIDDRNYFKLRDLAQLLSGTGSQFEVGYDEETATVSITTGAAYTPIGTELAEDVDNSASAQPSSQAIMIDGEKCDTLTVYNIGGSNFFQLRELGNVLGFEVDYNADTNTAIVNSK